MNSLLNVYYSDPKSEYLKVPHLVEEHDFSLVLFKASRIFCLTGLEFLNRTHLTFTFTEQFMPDPKTPGTLSNLFLLHQQIMPIGKGAIALLRYYQGSCFLSARDVSCAMSFLRD